MKGVVWPGQTNSAYLVGKCPDLACRLSAAVTRSVSPTGSYLPRPVTDTASLNRRTSSSDDSAVKSSVVVPTCSALTCFRNCRPEPSLAPTRHSTARRTVTRACRVINANTTVPLGSCHDFEPYSAKAVLSGHHHDPLRSVHATHQLPQSSHESRPLTQSPQPFACTSHWQQHGPMHDHAPSVASSRCRATRSFQKFKGTARTCKACQTRPTPPRKAPTIPACIISHMIAHYPRNKSSPRPRTRKVHDEAYWMQRKQQVSQHWGECGHYCAGFSLGERSCPLQHNGTASFDLHAHTWLPGFRWEDPWTSTDPEETPRRCTFGSTRLPWRFRVLHFRTQTSPMADWTTSERGYQPGLARAGAVHTDTATETAHNNSPVHCQR